MVNIPLPDLPDISDIDLPDLSDIDLPDLPTIPGTDFPNIPGIGFWPVVRDIDVPGMFWDLVDKADQIIVKHNLPLPKLRPLIEQFSMIDSEKFEQAALVWGKNHKEVGVPAAVGKGVADKVVEAREAVFMRWGGSAAESFKTMMNELTTDVLEKYGAAADQVGNILAELAEKYRMNWIEIIGLVGGAAGMIIGLATIPESGGLSLFIALVGAILGVIGVAVSVIDTLASRLGPTLDAIEKIRDEVLKDIPNAPDAKVPLPKGKWTPNNDDPYS